MTQNNIEEKLNFRYNDSMKFLLKFVALSLFLLSGLINAQEISDVSAGDGDYNSIRSSIEKGYLSVFSDQSFKPERPVSRREIALILDGVLDTVNKKKLNLSELEIKDLKALSASFKKGFVETENRLDSQESKSALLSDNQALIHSDLSKITERLTTLEETDLDSSSVKKLRKDMYLGLGIVGLLGIMLGGG